MREHHSRMCIHVIRKRLQAINQPPALLSPATPPCKRIQVTYIYQWHHLHGTTCAAGCACIQSSHITCELCELCPACLLTAAHYMRASSTGSTACTVLLQFVMSVTHTTAWHTVRACTATSADSSQQLRSHHASSNSQTSSKPQQ